MKLLIRGLQQPVVWLFLWHTIVEVVVEGASSSSSSPDTTAAQQASSSLPLVDNQYIVYFEDSLSPIEVETKADQVANAMGGQVAYVYQYVFLGVAVRNVKTSPPNSGSGSVDSIWRGSINSSSAKSSIGAIRNIQKDNRVSLDEFVPEDPSSITLPFFVNVDNVTDHNQTNIPMIPNMTLPNGLDRIDQVSLPLDGRYAMKWDGTGVTIYVLDTGLRLTHAEFANDSTNTTNARTVSCSFDFFVSNVSDTERRCRDGIGHGTHVSAIAAGRTVGVAKQASLVMVKIFSDKGESSDAAVLAGIDYVLQQRRIKPKNEQMVVNMSLGKYGIPTFRRAVHKLVDAGVVVVASAGNEQRWSLLKTPGSSRRAITVGASEVDANNNNLDRRASFSNFGPRLDIFAPGRLIVSAGTANDTAYIAYSGTSMAAPHVTGAVALYWQGDATLTPRRMRQRLVKDATKNALAWFRPWLRFSPNRLLYIGNI